MRAFALQWLAPVDAEPAAYGLGGLAVARRGSVAPTRMTGVRGDPDLARR